MENRCRRLGLHMRRTGHFVLAVLVLISAIGLTGHVYGDAGYHGGGAYYRGGHGGSWGGGVWIGPGWGWGGWGPWWWGVPYYPYYLAPPVVIERQPPVYIEPPEPEEERYWYYCRNPQGYYPYVQQCPGGWMKVLPYPVPSDLKE